ncbi:unnamed protein product [Eruca vesicaria subsp. sativa]|uniref:Uncharacterized protein n=1 Tax=Eruca vesicaria subsp. sativa TaxID=29727 RepID=A0ABC8KN00_ERUVS|nr:unnamed protein product [Eruca vesicaria subsp. sativa]
MIKNAWSIMQARLPSKVKKRMQKATSIGISNELAKYSLGLGKRWDHVLATKPTALKFAKESMTGIPRTSENEMSDEFVYTVKSKIEAGEETFQIQEGTIERYKKACSDAVNPPIVTEANTQIEQGERLNQIQQGSSVIQGTAVYGLSYSHDQSQHYNRNYIPVNLLVPNQQFTGQDQPPLQLV